MIYFTEAQAVKFAEAHWKERWTVKEWYFDRAASFEAICNAAAEIGAEAERERIAEERERVTDATVKANWDVFNHNWRDNAICGWPLK